MWDNARSDSETRVARALRKYMECGALRISHLTHLMHSTFVQRNRGNFIFLICTVYRP